MIAVQNPVSWVPPSGVGIKLQKDLRNPEFPVVQELAHSIELFEVFWVLLGSWILPLNNLLSDRSWLANFFSKKSIIPFG